MWKAAKTHTREECWRHVHCARDTRLKNPDFTVCRPRHRPNKPQHVACLPRADTPITVWEYRLDRGIGDNAPMHPVTLSEPFHPQNPPAAAGFDDPASLLHACHERVQERCRLLRRLLLRLRRPLLRWLLRWLLRLWLPPAARSMPFWKSGTAK